ncbi:zinc-binding alcohol dehydrogenase family protein [Paenilisteria rocourtiae]|uniref:Zinc-type alcohol dehydrogenase-like protein n=1 Tax=Listeria rocourtiae TaxID=647910 RepID=A0A4R6ZEJ5_9LIST|nr:zinc-binding alcohol dehydrogenase family protein [Listeria rocourtiae]EUJ46477.1 alcohol dehydrogenase [Listeria rocourtiae FSL F6-920]MBC1605901.1 zinc-binding alcohol dehydrogenase family protein [Listeria rocourtiae]TDR50601.1 zinc-binding alcohol dehydrogenase family protein [Listeria rocourtiae]
MKVVGLYEYLPIEAQESFLDVIVDTPKASGHDLLVRIQAISVNPVDTKLRASKVTVEETPRILGWDAVGIVTEIGDAVELFQVGDAVYYAGDVTRPGSYAEFQLVDEHLVGAKPINLSIEEAAAMPLTLITAWEALFDRIRINPDADAGKKLLIINGSGGVGSIATQLAVWAGLEVITTASRDETITWSKQQGATHVINHRKPLLPQLKALDLEGVEYILCLHNTDAYWDAMQEIILPQGHICSVVELQNPVSMSLIKDKSVTVSYEFMFTRSKYNTDDKVRQHDILTKATQLFEKGFLKTTLNHVLTPINAATIKEAHRMLESGKSIGKLVVKGFEENDEQAN